MSLDRKTITFRPNIWRRLKTPGSHRVVRLWPQLEEILGPYLHWRLMERGGRLCKHIRDLHQVGSVLAPIRNDGLLCKPDRYSGRSAEVP